MRMHGIRWMATMGALALALPMASAQSGRAGVRSPLPNLGSAVPGAERGSSVSGPTLGYVVDASTGNLHMVNGIAGSSTMGAPVHRGARVVVAAIAPSEDYAVIVDEAGDFVFYGRPAARGNSSVSLQAEGRVSHLATSPSGDAFVAYSAENSRFVIFEVEGGAPRMARSIAATPLNGQVERVALADGAGDPLVLLRDGSGTTLLRVTEGGARSLAVLPDAVELALFRNSGKALLLDRSQNTLYETDLSVENPALRTVASSANGIADPVGLALSDDNRTVAVANGASRKAVVFDLVTNSAVEVELPEAATGVRRMNSRAVFQLTDASAGPMLLLDVQAGSARAVYVPVFQSERGADAGRATLR